MNELFSIVLLITYNYDLSTQQQLSDNELSNYHHDRTIFPIKQNNKNNNPKMASSNSFFSLSYQLQLIAK